jgi:hypothetical protein
LTLIRSPAVASTSSRPIFPDVVIATDALVPAVVRPVYWTSPVAKGGGTTKKSDVLVAVPEGVVILNRPEAVRMGTLVVRLVALPLVGTARLAFKPRRLCANSVSKFVPLTVTEVPITPIVGVKLEIVGVAIAEVT